MYCCGCGEVEVPNTCFDCSHKRQHKTLSTLDEAVDFIQSNEPIVIYRFGIFEGNYRIVFAEPSDNEMEPFRKTGVADAVSSISGDNQVGSDGEEGDSSRSEVEDASPA